MPAHGYDAACTGAGVRKPSMKETAMGEGWWCGLHYGNYMPRLMRLKEGGAMPGVGRRGYGS